MKAGLSGVDIRAWIEEKREEIEGSWITNIYQLPNRIFLLKIRIPGVSGSHFLLLEPEKRMHFTNYARPVPKTPPNFCTTLRKHLRDKRINAIKQLGLDRVVELQIGPEPSYRLIIELMPRGALILVSPEGKIIASTSYKRMKDRDIHPGKRYSPPPSASSDILTLSMDEIREKLESETGKIGILLNRLLNVGPQWSKELLARAGVQNKPLKELEPQMFQRVLQVVEQFKHDLEVGSFSPVVILDKSISQEESRQDTDGELASELLEETLDDVGGDEKTVDGVYEFGARFSPEDILEIAPFQMTLYSDLVQINVDSFNDALDYFFSAQEEDYEIEEEAEIVIAKKVGLEKRLEEQQKHLETQKLLAREAKIKADLLYQYFNDVNELLHAIRTASEKKIPWETVIEKLEEAKKKGNKSAQIFSKLLPGEATVVVELTADSGERYEIPLDFRKTVAELADIMYAQAKRAEKKAIGAAAAIEETMRKLEVERQKGESLEAKAVHSKLLIRRKKKWYEKFRWFFTTEGLLAIGGLDASTNERIIKRYLDSSDLYFHADIHGAPSVVLKGGKENAEEDSIRQAAQFAIIYSSAWKAGIGAADAYYVLPDQVSFTPPSGQYLAKGAVMIYGEKKFVRHLPVRVGIGLIIKEQWVEIIGGPPEAIKARSDIYVELSPGDSPPGSIAKQILGIFSKKLNPEDQAKLKAVNPNEVIRFLPGSARVEKVEEIGKNKKIKD